MRFRFACRLVAAIAVSASALGSMPLAAEGETVLTVDHYVRVQSKVPSMAGQWAQIYVRERVQAGAVLRGAGPAGGVVLFVHGAGTPAEVAFDVPYQDYSWMAYLAGAGFDVFSMDTTGYGRSTRPTVMNDPCNLGRERQTAFIPGLLQAPCDPAYPRQLTTIESDWQDIDAVVEYIRALRKVERVHLIGWSLGGPRAGGYAAQHPEKVGRLVLLAPAYNRTSRANPPDQLPGEGVAMNTQSRQEFIANWDRQVGCADQYDPAVRDAVWSAMLDSDPVGATWGPGVRRAPGTTTWGFGPDRVSKMQTPVMAVAAPHDKQVLPERVRDFHADLGTKEKVLVDIACTSHNAMWERNRLLLFRASLEWLTQGSVNGVKEGAVQLGY